MSDNSRKTLCLFRGLFPGLAALVLVAAGLPAQPASAHISTDHRHLWKAHLLPLAKKTFYSKAQTRTLLSGYQKKYSHVVVVAQAGGAFTSPITALGTIAADCATDQRYLLYIAPGVYDLGTGSLTMKECVDVRGAGTEATVLRSQATPGTVVLANHATLSDLTVENNGANYDQSGVYSTGLGASARLENVVARSVNAANGNCGIQNESSSPTIFNVVAEASGGYGSYGICNASSSPSISHVRASGGGAHYGAGIGNSYGAPRISDSSCKGTGTTISYGIVNSYSSPMISNTTVEASGGGSGNTGIYFGIYNTGARPTLSGGTVTATAAAGSGGSVGIEVNGNSGGITISGTTVSATGGLNAYGMYSSMDGAIVNGSVLQASGATNNYAFRNGGSSEAFLAATTLVGTTAIENVNTAAGSLMMSGGRISGSVNSTDGRSQCSGVIKGSNAWAGGLCN